MNKSRQRVKLLILKAIILSMTFLISCSSPTKENRQNTQWEAEFEELLPLLGHRNWILVVDKAFPMQTAEGIRFIQTGKKIPEVLEVVFEEIYSSTHVKPVIYLDHELGLLTEDLVPGIEKYKNSLELLFKNNTDQGLSGNVNMNTILHDSVFVKINKASKLFKVLILKTEEIIPYSSVFIELDCKYWSTEKEFLLRSKIQ